MKKRQPSPSLSYHLHNPEPSTPQCSHPFTLPSTCNSKLPPASCPVGLSSDICRGRRGRERKRERNEKKWKSSLSYKWYLQSAGLSFTSQGQIFKYESTNISKSKASCTFLFQLSLALNHQCPSILNEITARSEVFFGEHSSQQALSSSL